MWAALCWATGESGPPPGEGPRWLRDIPEDSSGAPPVHGLLSPCRDGNSSVFVHFRLHFLLRGLRSLSLGLEEELLRQGLRARLRGRGIPLAAHGAILSAELTGK